MSEKKCTWSYRIVRYGDGGFGLHEVYYADSEPDSWTMQPVGFTADEKEGAEGIIKALRMALADAAQRPVLQIHDRWKDLVDDVYSRGHERTKPKLTPLRRKRGLRAI